MEASSIFRRWFLPNRAHKPEALTREGYTLRAIEFDDQGELWDPKQLTEAISHIQKECDKSQGGSAGRSDAGEVIVITFAHGWMHNAASNDGNYRKFEELICSRAKAEKAFAEASERTPRPIIGVYLGWRGLLWNLPLARYLTFWSRKAAALRVGHLSCTEVLFRIMQAVKSRNDRSQCIFVGHSFGGLILEGAICKALLGILLMKPDQPCDSPSDLVVLINPACEAIVAKQFRDILERNKVQVQKGDNVEKDGLPFPMLVSITSVGDKATKLAFPFGQHVVNLTKAFRKYADPDLPSQRYLSCHTAGHVTFFHDFEVQCISNGEINGDKLGFSFDEGENRRKYRIVPKCQGILPFWLMQVPREIVPNHSHIFTPGFESMLSALLQWFTTSVEPTKLRCSSRGLDPIPHAAVNLPRDPRTAGYLGTASGWVSSSGGS